MIIIPGFISDLSFMGRIWPYCTGSGSGAGAVARYSSSMSRLSSRFLALPAKLSPTLSTMGGDQTGIFDELKGAIEEILEEMSDYRVAFAAEDGEDDGEAEKETPM